MTAPWTLANLMIFELDRGFFSFRADFDRLAGQSAQQAVPGEVAQPTHSLHARSGQIGHREGGSEGEI